MRAFECKMCGACCYGEGGIFLHEEEIPRIAGYLGTTEASFVTRYCERRNGRLSIKAGPDKYCLFYRREKGCLIHPVKPSPCAAWPFYPAICQDADNWELAKEACPGINPDCPFEAFVRQSQQRAPSLSGPAKSGIRARADGPARPLGQPENRDRDSKT